MAPFADLDPTSNVPVHLGVEQIHYLNNCFSVKLSQRQSHVHGCFYSCMFAVCVNGYMCIPAFECGDPEGIGKAPACHPKMAIEPFAHKPIFVIPIVRHVSIAPQLGLCCKCEVSASKTVTRRKSFEDRAGQTSDEPVPFGRHRFTGRRKRTTISDA